MNQFTRRRLVALFVVLGIVGVAVAVSAGSDDSTDSAAPAPSPAAPAPAPDSSPLITKARRMQPAEYRAAVSDGAEVENRLDERAFTVWKRGAKRPDAVIVTMHGFKTTAFEQYAKWAPYARERGLGLLSLQWKQGPLRTDTFLEGAEIYAAITDALEDKLVEPGRVLLHGFSSAAFRVLGVTALDRREKKWFAISISNAGAPNRGYPTRELVKGNKAYAGTRWILFCGALDPHPRFTGCPAAERSKRYIAENGGRLEKLFVGPRDGHGGFLRHPELIRESLRIFARSLR